MERSTLVQNIEERTRRAIEEMVFPGCIVGIVTPNGERTILPFGNVTYEADSPKVVSETIYDVASLTKSIPTSSLALMLIDSGKLKLTDRLIDFIPEFRNNDRENVHIKHLMTYTLDGYGLASAMGGADGTSLSKRTFADFQRILLTHNFAKRPGEVFKYSNIPAALLGLVIEKIHSDTLDNLANTHFFAPLGMRRSTFFPELFPTNDIAPTEIDTWRGSVQGVVHDESAYICKHDGRIVGHAGLFSTAPDLLNFLEMLICGGAISGKKYFSEDIIGQIETNQIPELHDFTGLGWELNQPRYMGKHCGEHTFGKTGFTGTLVVCDRKKGIAYTILSNRTFPKRPADSTAMNRFRADIGDTILSSV